MFLKEGFDGFVSKPVEIEELERVLKQVLPKSSISFVDASEIAEEDTSVKDKIPQEASSKPAAEKDPMEELKKSGIDTVAGISYCVGDVDFYRSLLIQFATESADKMAAMKNYYSVRDWHNYEILVHALKSTSKMIGIAALSEKAKALEQAAKEDNEEYILDNHEQMLMDYNRVTADIKELLLSDDEEDEVFEFEPESNGGDKV